MARATPRPAPRLYEGGAFAAGRPPPEDPPLSDSPLRSPPRRPGRTHAERLRQEIAAAIADGRHPPGSTLDEASLAARYGVSSLRSAAS